MKECAHILPALHRLAEGELNAREAGKVIEHCRTCPECSEVLKDFRYMQGLLKKGLAKELSIPDFVGNVLASPPLPGRSRSLFRLLIRSAGISFAVISTVIIVLFVGYLYTRGFIGPKPTAGKLAYVSFSGKEWKEDIRKIRNRDSIITPAGERRSLRLNGGIIVILNEKTRLIVENANSLKLQQGDIYIDTAGHKGVLLRIRTREGVTYVTGTKLGVSAGESKTSVVVEAGKVRVESKWGKQVVVEGSVYSVVKNMQPEPPQTVDVEDMFFWIQERAYLAGMVMDVLEARSPSMFSDTALRSGKRSQQEPFLGRSAGRSSQEEELLREILEGLERSREQVTTGDLIIDVSQTEYGMGHDMTEEEQKKFIERVVAGQIGQLDPENPPDGERFQEIVQEAVNSATVKIEPTTSDRTERWVFQAPDRAKKQWLPDQQHGAITEMIINGEFRYWPNRSLEHCSVGFPIEGTLNSNLHILPNPCYSGRSSLPVSKLENPRIIGMEDIDGIPVYLLEADVRWLVTRRGEPIRGVQQLWVDPSRGYIVLKTRTYFGFIKGALQNCLETCAESFEELAPGFLYPRSFIRNMYEGDFVCGQKILRKTRETIYTLREGEFDLRLPQDEFTIPSNIPAVEVDREGRSLSELQRFEMQKRYREAEAERYVKGIYDELERIRLYDGATAPDSHKLILNVSRDRFGKVYRERGGIIYGAALHDGVPVGVRIIRVDPALAAEAPVLPGDIIYMMNERPFKMPRTGEMFRQLEECIVLVNQGKPVTFGLRRNGKLLYLILWVE